MDPPMSYHEVTIKQLREIMPLSSTIHIEEFAEPLNAAMCEFVINTPKRQAAFLAQIAHESGSLNYVRELASGEAYNGRVRLGNTKPEAIEIARRNKTTPGPFFKGRGLIQVTGYNNYASCSNALFADEGVLTNNPALLERTDLACRSAAWYWDKEGLNSFADAGDFETVTRKINGGLNGYADRVAYHQRAIKALAVNDGGGADAGTPFPPNQQKQEMPKWLRSFLQLFRS
jgi:putative chitinase